MAKYAVVGWMLLLLVGCAERKVTPPAAVEAEREPRTVLAEVPVGGDTSLTERLQRTLDRLATVEAENARLRKELGSLRDQLAKKDRELKEAQNKLATYSDRIKALERDLAAWKKDVLGFRDEMREAEKAQMEALVKVIKLLKQMVTAAPAAAKEGEAK